MAKYKINWLNHDAIESYSKKGSAKFTSPKIKAKVTQDPQGVFGVPYGKLAQKNVGWGLVAVDVGLNTFFNIKEGNSISTSLIKGTLQAIPYAIMPGPMFTYDLTRAGVALAKAAHQYNRVLSQKYTNMINPQPRFTYMDTRQALTMRQAAVQAIQGSKLNARNALGGEAALMHRSTRIY